MFLDWNSSAVNGISRGTDTTAKFRAIASHISQASVATLKEVHGDQLSLQVFCQRFEETHWAFASACDNAAAGGVVTFVSKVLVPDQSCMREVVVVPGRILLVSISVSECCLHICNIHNFDLAGKTAIIRTCLQPLIDEAVAEPYAKSFLAMGDMNFDDNPIVHIAEDRPIRSEEKRRWRRPMEDFFLQLFSSLLELQQDEPTRASLLGDSSSIDRAWVSLPSSMVGHVKVVFKPLWPASWGVKMRLSDHAPMTLFFSDGTLNGGRSNLPRWIALDPMFGSFLNDELIRLPLSQMSPVQRWREHKQAILRAAKKLREYAFKHWLSRSAVQFQLLNSLNRAVWFNDIRLFHKCITDWPLLGDLACLLPIQSYRTFSYRVRFVDFPRFQEMFRKLKHADLETELTKQLDVQKSRQPSRIFKWLRLWSPHDRQLKLGGVRTKCDDKGVPVIVNGKHIQEQLAAHWSKVFDTKPVHIGRRDEFLRKFQCTFTDFSPPSIHRFMKLLRSLASRPTAPGPDGIPYNFWAVTPFTSAWTLLGLMEHIIVLGSIPDGFNASCMLWIPKGWEEEDGNVIVRSAEDTRPLTLRNSDNKIISAAAGLPLGDAVAEKTNFVQQGFIRGRNFLSNVVDADAYARAAALCADGDRATLAAYDFGAAFPSLCHDYLFAALAHAGLPSGLCTLIMALYAHCDVLLPVCGKLTSSFVIRAGVLQGCPLSGLLFVVAMEPFLNLVSSKLGDGEIVRACADDVLTVTKSVRSLRVVALAFEYFGEITNLRLKIKKVFLIPLGVPCTTEAIENFRDAVRAAIPSFSGASIQFHCKYLGFWIGPQSAHKKWVEQSSKFRSRVALIASAKRAATITVPLYNSRAVSTLSYHAQLDDMPESILKDERHCIERVLKVLPSTFSMAAIASLHHLKLPQPILIRPMILAARSRAARVTLSSSWKLGVRVLQAANETDGFLLELAHPTKYIAKWDTPAFALLLQEAAESRVVGFEFPVNHSGFQRRAYTIFRDSSYKFYWQEFLKRRIVMTYPNLDAIYQSFDFGRLVQELAKLRPILSFAVLRWWLNAIPTHVRLHDSGFDLCPFCCNHKDFLPHVLVCCKVNQDLYFLMNGPFPAPLWEVQSVQLGITFAGRSFAEIARNLFCFQFTFTSLRRAATGSPPSRDYLFDLQCAALVQLNS